MRSIHTLSLAIAAALLLAGSTAHGQTLLNRAEGQLPGATGGAAPLDAAAVPGSGYLGLFPDEAYQGGNGVRVHSVKPGGPAEASGLKAGDLIIAIDAKAITKLVDLDEVLGKATAGQKVQFTIERDGKVQSPLKVTLGTRPPPAATPAEATGNAPTLAPPSTTAPSLTDPTPRSAPATIGDAPPPPLPSIGAVPGGAEPATPAPGGISARPLNLGSPPADQPTPAEGAASAAADSLPTPAAGAGGATLGITVVPLTEEARSAYRITARRGALITSVRPGSPADRAGLPIGGVVVSIDGRRIDAADDLVAVIRGARAGQEIELTYYEGDRLGRKTVKLAPSAVGTVPAIPPREGPTGPLGLGTGPGTGNDRPLLSRVERMVDSMTQPRGPSTVYNPADMAALQARMMELTQQMQKLDERMKALESKLGTAPTATSPAPPPAPAPAFGGGLSPPGTNP